MKKLLLAFLFILFYRPVNGTRAWSLFGAYDTLKEAREARADLEAKGGPYEYRVTQDFAWKVNS